MYCTSLGKSLLLDMTDAEICLLLDNTDFEAFGPNTHKNMDSLMADLHRCKARGWTHDDQEAEPDVNCVAAPIRDYRGQIMKVAAAISAAQRR